MVHRDRDGWPLSINGDFYPLPEDFGFEISVDSDELGVLVAIALDADEASIDLEELLVCDTGWWGDRPSGVRLAHHVIARGADALPHHILIDASNGQLLDRWPAFHQVINRQVHDANIMDDLPGNLSRSEGQSATNIDEVNAIYDYLGDFYQFFDLGFDRDSIDGNGGELQGTARFLPPNITCSIAAYFDVTEVYAVFCFGFEVDDIIAHEFCHGLIINTADLIYQNQSGQLNESFADVFGELVDLWNGNCQEAGPPGTGWPTHPSGSGGDTPNSARTGSCFTDLSVRWLLGEDSSTGFAARDMWSPECMNDPPNALHDLYRITSCNPNIDSGGVHSGSGVPNHAFAMATDGKNFNGYTVSGIGPIKSAAVWFRALTMYMTPATDFNQAYGYFNQAAADLVGTNPNDPRTGQPSASNFTLADAIQIENALLAVEMNEPVDCCAAVGDLTCQTDYGSVEAGWTVNGYYDALEVTIDGILVDTLPGDAVGYSGTADIGNHTLDVIPVCTGTVSSTVSCTFDVPVPFTFTVPDTGGVFSAITGEGGFTASLEIYENPGSTTYPTPTQGFSMDLLSSPSGNFTITEVLRTTVLDELNGGNGPEFFEVKLFTESFSVEVVYGNLNNVTLQFEESVPVVTANYQTVPG
ncbi:MAG TPA: hypothetical protein EYN79_07785, partial [Planctomycetes bacterium]|nr:hypothetical protein [Planctomycetota bacterium]